MLKIGPLSLLKRKQSGPLLCRVSLRVHIRSGHEYHSNAYAVRVAGDTTELLVADQFHKLMWIDIAEVEAVEEMEQGVLMKKNA
jgi:hypothetical protein